MITLTGTLRFTTRSGATFVIAPGDVLLAADTTGGGHRWELIDDQPWTGSTSSSPRGLPGSSDGQVIRWGW